MFICKHLHVNINVSLIFQTQHLAKTTLQRGLATAYPLNVCIHLPAIPYTTDLLEQIHNVRLLRKLFMLSLFIMLLLH